MILVGLVLGASVFGSLKIGLMMGLAGGVLVSVISHFIIERLSSSGVNLLYGKRKPIWTQTEKFEGPLNQARHLKSKQDYVHARNMVDDILAQAPKFPDALYLKAQILWEGYRDAPSSRKVLAELLAIVPDKHDTYHRWAQSLLDDIGQQSSSS